MIPQNGDQRQLSRDEGDASGDEEPKEARKRLPEASGGCEELGALCSPSLRKKGNLKDAIVRTRSDDIFVKVVFFFIR